MKTDYIIGLTADRTLMSEYAGNTFFGLLVIASERYLLDWMYCHFIGRSVPVPKENGEALYYPIDMRINKDPGLWLLRR
jgi:hypothetical protein